MLTRFRKSRGYGKFKRNRGAMVALVIIGLYAALGAWVWSVENINALGRMTGWWDLGDSRYVGVLLPERTLERVGPPLVAGFGMEQDLARRTDQADWMMKFVGETLASARALPEDQPTSPAEFVARAHLAERRLADRSLDELEAAYAEGQKLFSSLDSIKLKKGLLSTAVIAAQHAEEAARGAVSVTDEDTPAYRRELATTVDDFAIAFDDFARSAQEDDPIVAAVGTSLLDAADALFDAEQDESVTAERAGELVPLGTIEKLRELAPERLKAFDAEIHTALAGIEKTIAELVPQPEGADGLLYRFKMLLGTDRQGRSIMIRSLYSAKIAVQVGAVVAFFSVLIGAVLGAAAAFFGGWVDRVVIWLYSTLSTLPQLVLLAVLTFMFLGSRLEGTLFPLYAAFCLTFWIGPCRVVRGEVLKIRQLEYVQAATAIGFSRPYILLKHALPNTLHLAFINFSLLFIGAIKSEVILTFLGLGVKDGASWGIMISQSRPEVVIGFFWQIGAATFFMLVLVLAFNVVSDALQDAFDPKHVG